MNKVLIADNVSDAVFKVFDENNKEYSPVTHNVSESVKMSEIGSAHVLIQGLLPAPKLKLKEYNLKEI